jgi:CHAT domain-containing protein
MADVNLNAAVAGLRAAGAVASPAQAVPSPAAPPDAVLASLIEAGTSLFAFLLNSPAEADLRFRNLFLELGTDESLVNYPWELMYDDDDFLCMKHYVGRYVNTTKIGPPRMQVNSDSTEWDTIQILIISVPGPPGAPYLPGAKAETDALIGLFAGMPQVSSQILRAPEATVANVRKELRSGRYQIVHFCGHASYDAANPRNSALLLHDFPFTAGQVITHLKSAVISVVNACQTAEQAAVWDAGSNNFSLGRAFMEAESYLLGSRWKLSDNAASIFAVAFYKALLEDWKPIGEAVQVARRKCKDDLPASDVGWASYVYYGDPRLAFEPAP